MGFSPTDFSDENFGSSSWASFAEVPPSVAASIAMDKCIRQMFLLCWTFLPKERRTLEGFEKEIHRRVDRALKNLRDDSEIFDIPEPG